MFIQVLSSTLGILFLSLSLMIFSSNINSYLNLFLIEHLKQVQETIPVKFLRDLSTQQFSRLTSFYFFLSGLSLYWSQGFIRLLTLIFLSIFSLYTIQLIIISGLSISNYPIYIFLLFSILILLFHDCSQFDDLQLK